jgi:hypothetical protein
MPAAPWPNRAEFRDRYIAGANTNPFTGQQQTQDWQARFKEASISYATLTQAQATAFLTFLESLNGIINVFQFPAGLAAKYPESFTSDGTNQRYWRLAKNDTSWVIKIGSVYNLTFEMREAI